MSNVELGAMLRDILKSIRLYEFKRVVGLRIAINTKNLKPSPVVSHAGATRLAEQIKEPRH
ncbi:hypothetical protein [Mycobacteroides saopaulense]|uniref:hypothetical protein n=1 Tax=Mycobacteroides saopaulense TaxID=1578165 RepID=UPI0008A975AC|nr:hypothetical protein [Mycobacteroides saopaulense]